MSDLHLHPGAGRARPIHRCRVFRHEALEAPALDGLPRTVSPRLEATHRQHHFAVGDRLLEDRASLLQGARSEIVRADLEQVERDEHRRRAQHRGSGSPSRWNRLTSCSSNTATSPSSTRTSCLGFAMRASSRKRPVWSTAFLGDHPDRGAVLVGEQPPPVHLLLVDPAGAMERGRASVAAMGTSGSGTAYTARKCYSGSAPLCGNRKGMSAAAAVDVRSTDGVPFFSGTPTTPTLSRALNAFACQLGRNRVSLLTPTRSLTFALVTSFALRVRGMLRARSAAGRCL